MFRTWMLFLLSAVLLGHPDRTSAIELTLDFEGAFGTLLDGTNSFTYADTADGESFQFVLSATGGKFNITSSGFGINAPGSGDDTDALDNGLVAEAIRFAFDTTADVGIKLVSLEFDRLTGSGGSGEDQALVSFYSAGALDNSVTVTNANTAGDDKASFNGVSFPEQIFNPGSYFDLSVADGNGFGLEKVVIDVGSAYFSAPSGGGGGSAVPEPTTACLLAAGLCSMLGVRRRRLRR